MGKIDKDQLRAMVQEGKITREIAAHFGVSSPSITRACHANRIPLPKPSYGGKPLVGGKRVAWHSTPPVAPQAPTPAHPPRMAELIATGGRYADLRAWASRWGVTETKARQEWHKLGLQVSKGAMG